MYTHKYNKKECIEILTKLETVDVKDIEKQYNLLNIITKGKSGDRLLKIRDKKNKKMYILKILFPNVNSIMQVCININLLTIPNNFLYPKIFKYGKIPLFHSHINKSPKRKNLAIITRRITI
jgi:hypothetical protein